MINLNTISREYVAFNTKCICEQHVTNIQKINS
jgi:hypothetical protein